MARFCEKKVMNGGMIVSLNRCNMFPCDLLLMTANQFESYQQGKDVECPNQLSIGPNKLPASLVVPGEIQLKQTWIIVVEAADISGVKEDPLDCEIVFHRNTLN